MRPIREVKALTAQQFNEEILPNGQPAIFRGLIRDWPVVDAGKVSGKAFCDYIRSFDRGYPVNTVYGNPSINGRIFYNEDLSGLNCRMGQAKLSASLEYLQDHANKDPAPTLAVQSVLMNRYLPGLAEENRLPDGLVPEDTDPRLWLGGRATIAAHYDPSENLACCVAGRRRFTLFPPEQVQNLYIGPFEMTPAGATISMVDFDHPDHDRYPGFREAETAAVVADLAPGDVIYIPYMWWHHVRSLDSINGLVNYWWSRAPAWGGDPRNTLLHAMMTLRELPSTYRDAWKSMFEHYVFGDHERASMHLPVQRRGILGEQTEADIKQLKQALAKALSRT